MSQAEYERDLAEDRRDNFMAGTDDCDGCCHYEGSECDKCSHCVKDGCYADKVENE